MVNVGAVESMRLCGPGSAAARREAFRELRARELGRFR